MSCPFNQDAIDKLKQFIDVCKSKPDILHVPGLSFFKEYLESLGAQIPEPKMSKPAASGESCEEPHVEGVESDPESDLDITTDGCVEPDVLDENQKMGNPDKEVTEEDSDKANDKRAEAMQQFSEGNYDKAIQLFTEAIELNPNSALLYAKRGQTYLKLNKPNACIKDCSRALELNCDSAAAYKFRGRAHRLLGDWEKSAKDLRQACNIDFDEQTDEWLKEVTPNAKKIEQHKLKLERKKQEKEEKEKLERIRKAREAHAKASAQANTSNPCSQDSSPEGGAPGMGDFYKLLQDPEIMAAFKDPEVATAFQDISTNPANFIKYQSNPKIMALISKLSSKFAGSGMNFPGFPGAGGFPGFPGGAPFGASAGQKTAQQPPEDDNLD